MRSSQERHDALLSEEIAAHGGHVFKTIGDAFQAAFVDPVQALAAAVAVQRGLSDTNWGATGPLRVRMGIHVGQAEAGEQDYVTTPILNRVARVMAAAHGGQILISQSVAELVGRALPPDLSLRDMGRHHMKGLREPEHLYQVVAADLPQEFPALATLDHRPGNLPSQTTPFVGRRAEISTVRNHLSQTRLLTLRGPGGAGKTRLALQIAGEVEEEFPDGTWFVDLAPLSDPALVPQVTATTIGLREKEGGEILNLLASYLHNRKALLILDNCEHVVPACAHLADNLLRSTTQTRFLATSRQNLGLTSEVVFPVAGMGIPQAANGDGVIDHPAVQLFLQSARRVALDFQPGRAELQAIVRICRLVQGMPLGIVLAAAWIDVLTVEEIAEEISNSADFLQTEMRDLPLRQQSIRAAFEYSWKLLGEEERSALAGVAVFRGGFDRRAFNKIVGASFLVLNRLVQKSLLQRDAESGRFGIHELLRQFAKEQLSASGHSSEVRKRHREYYLGYLAQTVPDLKGGRQLEVLDEIEADFENIRLAWQSSVREKDAKSIDRALEGLYLYSMFRSHFAEGRELFRLARGQWPASAPEAPALAGRLLVRYPDEESLDAVFRRGLEIARESGDEADIAYSLNQLGRHLMHTGTDEQQGLSLLEQARNIYRHLGDDYAIARVLDDISFGYGMTDQEQRVALGKQSLALRRRIGDQIGVANVQRNLAVALFVMGQAREGRGYVEEAIRIARRTGDLSSVGWMLSLKAEYIFYEGRTTQCRIELEEAHQIGLEVNDENLTRNCLINRALFLALIDEEYLRAREVLTEARPDPTYRALFWSYQCVDILVKWGIGRHEEAADSLYPLLHAMKGSGLGLDSWPCCAPLSGLIFLRKDQLELAAESLGYFDSLPPIVTKWGESWPPLGHLRTELERRLGREEYEIFRKRGLTLDPERIMGNIKAKT